MSIIDNYISLAKEGTRESIGTLMKKLNRKMTLADSKFLDYALSFVESQEGVKIMEHYLFYGTKLQRNYCTLYFLRKEEYQIVQKAYDEGLVDARQAFSR